MSMTLQHKQENMLFKRKWQKSVYKEGCDGLVFFFWQKLLIRLDSASNLVFCKFLKNQSTTLIINEQKAETKQFPLKGAFLFNRNFCKSNNSFQETFCLVLIEHKVQSQKMHNNKRLSGAFCCQQILTVSFITHPADNKTVLSDVQLSGSFNTPKLLLLCVVIVHKNLTFPFKFNHCKSLHTAQLLSSRSFTATTTGSKG